MVACSACRTFRVVFWCGGFLGLHEARKAIDCLLLGNSQLVRINLSFILASISLERGRCDRWHFRLGDEALVIAKLLHCGTLKKLSRQGLSFHLGENLILHLVQLSDYEAILETLGCLLLGLENPKSQLRVSL